jgi:hypothetical protein
MRTFGLLLIFLQASHALASPPIVHVDIRRNACIVRFYSDLADYDDFVVMDTKAVTGYMHEAATCYGTDSRDNRPPVAIESGFLGYTNYGICKVSLDLQTVRLGFWKALILPDGRFQVICGISEETVKQAKYFPLVNSESAPLLKNLSTYFY